MYQYGNDDFNDKVERGLFHSFIQAISIAHYYSEALLTQHGYCVGISRRSATGQWLSVYTFNRPIVAKRKITIMYG